MTQNIKEKIKASAKLTEAKLREYFERYDEDIKELLESEQYSLFAGGKRIRPFLVIEFCKLFGGRVEAALPFAAAVEMIHTYSLIHDDLPCMDNDDLRRGKPTNHKVFGYSTALLAGDGLLTRAFGVAASNPYVDKRIATEATVALSDAAGDFGMIGGQIIDLYGEKEKLSEEKLLKLHSLKTGALIKVSAMMGVLAAGYDMGSPEMESAIAYASGIGLAFQIVDDIMDVTVSEEVLGKSAGSDAENNKTTFMTYYTVDAAREYAAKLTAEAVSAIADYEHSETLTDLAAYLLDREN